MKNSLIFSRPIYVTRPLLPDLEGVFGKITETWNNKILSNCGPMHTSLEQELTKLLRVKHLSLFNNGTIALIAALKALDLKGEVITTPFTFSATVHSIIWANLKPVFCDIDENSLCIDPNQIESLITDKTSAILGVHVFGRPCDVQAIDVIAKKYNLKVIYDAAHAFMAEIDGYGIGSFGDITMYSFHATKLFHTLEGGALSCNNEILHKQLELYRNFGILNEEQVVLPGINGKMNEIQSLVGLENLKYLEIERNKRLAIYDLYVQLLQGISGISTISIPKNVKNSLQYFPILVDKDSFGCSRNELYLKLKEYNVFARKYFYPLCCDYACYQDINSSHITVARKIGDSVLCLPFYGDLLYNEVQQICNIISYIKQES